MSNLLTLTQDEITRFGIEDKVAGDVITAEEYSKFVKNAEKAEKPEKTEKSEEKPEEKAKKAK